MGLTSRDDNPFGCGVFRLDRQLAMGRRAGDRGSLDRVMDHAADLQPLTAKLHCDQPLIAASFVAAFDPDQRFDIHHSVLAPACRLSRSCCERNAPARPGRLLNATHGG
jgi:hypothetical protein